MTKCWIRSRRGFTLLELMMITAIIALLLAIAIPNFITYRHLSFCTQAENDALNVRAAIIDYFGVPTRTRLPDPAGLKTPTNNPFDVRGDVNTTILIVVTDRSGRCPDHYQSASDHWDAENNIFYSYIR